KGSTQLITNRGFLSSEFGRKYYDEKEENEVPRDENFPTSQALGISAISNADLLIIGGTSLAVYPAASFIDYYKGDYIALINKANT
ncbi:hypothetical protein ACTPEF_24095, partial [Clostridioides difficile]